MCWFCMLRIIFLTSFQPFLPYLDAQSGLFIILRSAAMSDNSLHKIETDEKKRIRRSRKDGHERTYVCSQCQKSYLSNAALYTHTKTKHQNQG